METEILTGEDIRFLAQQPDAEVGIILGQMTTLMQNINDLQQDTDDKVAKLESQGWFKRMTNTLFGRNKATKQEIQKNNDKVVTYISQSVAQLYQMNMINERIICSLGNRMNEVYMQVTNMYQEQLNMKAQISQIMAVQQQTLETMGAFVSKLNEKIESVDNFHMLISEIQNGMYSDSSRLYNMCSILSQLDKRQMDDSRKMNLLRDTMERAGVITQEEFTVQKCLQEIVALPTEKIGLIYMELCNFRQSFPANLFADMIESYHFLSKMERMSKKKELIIQRVMDAYELDADNSFSVADIADSFFENKQGCLVTLDNVPKIEMHDDNAVPQPSDLLADDAKLTEDEIIELINNLLDEEKTTEALEIAKKYADEGIAFAQFVLGNLYGYGIGIKEDEKEAFIWWQKAAEQGYAKAQFNLASYFENGTGCDQNYSLAFSWYKKAAEQGHAEAQNALGIYYHNGWGVEIDENKAFEWIKKAAEQGYAEAQYWLGYRYSYGQGVDRDYTEAAKWFRKAAEQGQVDAQERIAAYYYNGLGVAKDQYEAVEWYKMAAEQGNAKAQYRLGQCYDEGNGCVADKVKSFEWIKKAAMQGYGEAFRILSEYYEKGYGCQKNNKAAVYWKEKAWEFTRSILKKME